MVRVVTTMCQGDSPFDTLKIVVIFADTYFYTYSTDVLSIFLGETPYTLLNVLRK